MSKNKRIENIIKEILSDGEEHSIKEFKEKCEKDGVSLEVNKNAISNVLFNLKNEGIIRGGTEIGRYRMGKADNCETKSIDNENLKKIDWNNYFVLKPERSSSNEKKVTITERGEIRLNSILYREIHTREIEFVFSNDCKEMILNLNGDNPYKITKAGIIKNKEIVQKLKKNGIEFPVSYKMKWDKDIEMWRGFSNAKIK